MREIYILATIGHNIHKTKKKTLQNSKKFPHSEIST